MYVENKNGELDHICGGTLISEEFGTLCRLIVVIYKILEHKTGV